MHWRYRLRKQQLLDECEVPPEVFQGGLERLAEFARPFAECLGRREQRDHARTYLAGLVSDLKHKTAESIAYRHGQERHGLQHFVGSSTWEHRPLLRELAGQVGREIGTPDGVIVFDPSGFAKKGGASAGVQRQWLGRLGKVDNGQVGVFMAYASYHEHALVDVRLYLPKAWAKDRARRKRCGIPKAVRYRTRHELALEMLEETGPLLPHGWVTGDDEMGRSSRFRAELRRLNERYLLAVPSNTTVRDLEGAAARVGRPWAAPEAGLRAGPGLVQVPAGGGVAADRGGRRRAGAAARRDGLDAGGGADGPGADRAGGAAGGDPAPRRGRGDEARLLPVRRPAGDAAGGAGAGGQGGAPGRALPAARQERGGAGRIPGADLVGLAPPPGVVADRGVVPGAGGASGEKR